MYLNQVTDWFGAGGHAAEGSTAEVTLPWKG